jgi:hypothetical protein
MEKSKAFSRRSILKGAGALVVSIGMPISLETVLGINAAFAQSATKPPLTPEQLSSYIAINADGTVSAFSERWIWAKACSRRSDRSWRRSSTYRFGPSR